MRKSLSIFIVFFCICCSLFADGQQQIVKNGPGDNFVTPRGGASGIPMAPDRGNNNDHYTIVKTSEKPWEGESSTGLSAGYYTGQEIIVSAGVKNFKSNVKGKQSAKDVKIYVTVNCPNGFFFSSAKNPSYRRPFEFAVVPRAVGTDFVDTVLSCSYGPVKQINSTKQTAEFTLGEVLPNEKKFRNPVFWFDLVLELPGVVNSGDILITDKGQYPLIVADDYNAVVEVTMITSYMENGKEVLSDPTTVVVPFSGDYSPSGTGLRDTSNNISMYIKPTAAAGNLDLKNYNRQEIANLRMQSTMDIRFAFGTSPAPEDSFYIFLSSSNEPSVAGDHFKLVLEGMKYGTPLTPYNSVEYEVILVNEQYDDIQTKNKEIVYTGTDTGTATSRPNLKSVYPERTLYTTDARFDGEIPFLGRFSEDTYVWDYKGTAYVKITNNSGYVMKAGRYTSKVYVHVIDI